MPESTHAKSIRVTPREPRADARARYRTMLRAGAYAAILLWVNLYIARDFFSGHTAYMNSMHGFWIAMAKRGWGAWLHPVWWPYWDCGIPYEAAYAPLVPWLTAAWAAVFRTPFDMAFSSVTGAVYCLVPISLFLMAWGLTRAAGTSFFAALFYSLASPTQWIVPDGEFRWDRILEARRLFLVAAWDDTPHLTALALLPLAALFLALSIERRRRVYYAAAAMCMALMAAASAFGPIIAAMAGAALLAAAPQAHSWKRVALVIAGIGAYAYLMAIAFMPPSVLRAIGESTSVSDEEKWTLGSITGVAAAVLGFTILRYLLRRYKVSSRVEFFAYFAWIAGSVPLAVAYLHRRIMPQPVRYKFELELGLALVAAFAGRALLRRFPLSVRSAAIFVALALAAEQVAAYRKLEKTYQFPRDVTQTVEYRASIWTAQNLPGVRVFFPGSMAQWANAFTDVPQFTGGSWSMATNQSQQNADAAILFETGALDAGAKLSLTWLKAYGVGAIAVTGAKSEEYWKPFSDPAKFDSLPALWSQRGVTIRSVPARSTSLAHVVPESAISKYPPKTPEDSAGAARYVAAIEDLSMPLPALEWQGPERMRIRADLAPGQAVSVQEGYHSGWRARVNGRSREVFKDGLGLMWLRPECTGACEILLEYGGGWEWWISHGISCAAIGGMVVVLFWRKRGVIVRRLART
jgi:hypothetical protein